jgi:Tfp pilus assembly protein PilX
MTRRLTSHREDGAVLVLALVFMIVIALVLLGVVSLAGNDLLNTSNLLDQQSLEYRSSGAMQVAIQTVRYTNTTFLSPPSSCFTSNTGIQVGQNSPRVYVDCMTVPHSQLPANTGVSREVNFYACGTSSTSCSSTNYTVWATVDFVDGPTCTSGSFGACGTTESVKSWLVHNANN